MRERTLAAAAPATPMFQANTIVIVRIMCTAREISAPPVTPKNQKPKKYARENWGETARKHHRMQIGDRADKRQKKKARELP